MDVAAVGIGGEPLARREGVAAGVMKGEPAVALRTAKVRPSAATRMSGTGVSPAQITATSMIATPLQRSGVLGSIPMVCAKYFNGLSE